MERKIVLSLFYMGIVTAIAGIVITTMLYYGFFRKEVVENLVHECQLVAQCYDKITSPEELERFAGENFRITLIQHDGTVLFESDAEKEQMPNHLDRPEIQSAIEHGTGSDTRYSDTIGMEDYYYAVRLADNRILRVSMQADSIFLLFERSLLVVLLLITAIVIVSLFVSMKLTDRLIAPLKGIPDMITQNKSAEETGLYPEIVPLAEEIRSVRSAQETMRQEFTANVSHELKTPLTSILGYAELIETGMAKGEMSMKFAGKIRTEAMRMMTLIGDILRLSELDAIEHAPLDDTIDLLAIVRECQEQLACLAAQRGIRIHVSGNAEPFSGNRPELHELVYHLIDNAIKYNRENGNIDIQVRSHTLTVSDTGIGIPKESIPRIFERFYRADKSRSRAKGGTGLGLSIVRHIAEHHNATIEVDSVLSVGTTITVTFSSL